MAALKQGYREKSSSQREAINTGINMLKQEQTSASELFREAAV